MVQKVFVSSMGWAVIICPECGQESHHKPGKDLLNKVLETRCRCGAKYQVLFDTRMAPRKDCIVPGILSTDKNIAVEINYLSERGACFEVDESEIEIGNIYTLKLKIEGDWIEALIRVVRINKNVAGFEFVDLGYNQKRMIESYILSDESGSF